MTLPAPVRRALARDDLLTLAGDAEVALGIVRDDNLAKLAETDADLFRIALDKHMAVARSDEPWPVRSHALYHAGAIVRFCALAGMPATDTDDLLARYDPGSLYREAVERLTQVVDGERKVLDPAKEVMTTYRRIRDLRLSGDLDAAIDLAEVPQEYFLGSGAEPYRGHFQYELGAALLHEGQAGQVAAALAESAGYWETTRARDFVSRNRYDVILGLAGWVTREDPAKVAAHLARAGEQLRRVGKASRYDVHRLSLALTTAEHLSSGGSDPATVAGVVEIAREALTTAERIRSRWSVIARSRSPLSMAFRRVYGDIALLVAGLPGDAAAELGLRIALSAKQTGFASRMRTGRGFMTRRLRTLMEEILREEALDNAPGLADLKRELLRVFPRLLADTVLPAPARVDELRNTLGRRYAVDYVSLPDSLSREENWFRALLRPDRPIEFTAFTPGPGVAAYFDGEKPWIDHLRSEIGRRAPDWRGLAAELLPPLLLDDLAERTATRPLELVISAHGRLSMVPWLALAVEDDVRLIERALVTQTPALTCLSDAPIPTVEAPALVRLVTGREHDVRVPAESEAWALRPGADGTIPLSSCDFVATATPAPLTGRLAAALTRRPRGWRFTHIAAHGHGSGLDQTLDLPEPLPAGQALALPWPDSVLMASCKVGRLLNIADAEPVSFVMALLTGGSRCVVAAIDGVPDGAAGSLAADIVEQVRLGPVRLDQALRKAQLRIAHRPAVQWALFNAYVR